MTRINLKSGKVIKPGEFIGGNPERQLQTYVEKNLEGFFGCHILKSFYNIPSGEIDTLAITEEGNPCIIEYKHRKEDTITNQIVFYYDWLRQPQTKYEYERIVKENKNTENLAVDWSKIRLICIAKEYSEWDKSLIKHLDNDIECFSYLYHEDELDVHLDPIVNQYKRQKAVTKPNPMSEPTLEDHRNRADSDGKSLLDNLRKEILKIADDVKEGYAPDYIKYYVNTTFVAIHVRKKWLIVELKVNSSTFKDPKKMTKDISARKWPTNRELKVSNMVEITDVIDLIKQAYETQK